ncbi:hypothetical protein XENOCAPTIV_015566 [Xenoophorus captivus]|uniref:Uncharacterized protein n=1 Tax=Xenoophorus captivus TaxID=1517983 RepID=A0ABV0S748_9TELE
MFFFLSSSPLSISLLPFPHFLPLFISSVFPFSLHSISPSFCYFFLVFYPSFLPSLPQSFIVFFLAPCSSTLTSVLLQSFLPSVLSSIFLIFLLFLPQIFLPFLLFSPYFFSSVLPFILFFPKICILPCQLQSFFLFFPPSFSLFRLLKA